MTLCCVATVKHRSVSGIGYTRWYHPRTPHTHLCAVQNPAQAVRDSSDALNKQVQQTADQAEGRAATAGEKAAQANARLRAQKNVGGSSGSPAGAEQPGSAQRDARVEEKKKRQQ